MSVYQPTTPQPPTQGSKAKSQCASKGEKSNLIFVSRTRDEENKERRERGREAKF